MGGISTSVGQPVVREGLKRHFSRIPRAVVQLSILSLVAVLTCCALTMVLAIKINRNEVAQKQRMVTGAIAREQDSLTASTSDYAHWDDAVDHLYAGIDHPWLATNFGGAYPLYVIDSRGRTLHGWWPSIGMGARLDHDAPKALTHLLPLLPTNARAALRAQTIAFQSSVRGQPAFVSAAAILPSTKTKALPRGPLFYVVMFKPVDTALMKSWARAYELDGIHIIPAVNSAPLTSVAFPTTQGSSLVYLVWPPAYPGLVAVRQIAPALGFAAIFFLAISVVLTRSIVRAHRALDTRTATAERLAEESAQSLLRAEQATSKAEAARADLARAAQREKAEQARHADELKKSAHAAGDLLERTIGTLASDLRRQADSLEASAAETTREVHFQEQTAAKARRASSAMLEAIYLIDSNVERLVRTTGEIHDEAVRTETAMRKTDRGSSAAIAANKTLLEQVASISSASDVIRTLAAETNMLALNASIEAQHAGAAGAGFAVVANEVKGLARRTKERTGDIAARLEAVENAAQSIGGLVGAVHQLLSDLNASFARTSNAVSQHHRDAETIMATGREVAADADMSHRAVSEISEALKRVGGFADRTSEIGATVRSRAEQLSHELTQIIESLKNA